MVAWVEGRDVCLRMILGRGGQLVVFAIAAVVVFADAFTAVFVDGFAAVFADFLAIAEGSWAK